MWYKVKKIYVGTQQVRPVNKFVFDFQNNWLQGCTLSNTQYFGYEAWQWIYWASNSVSVGCEITLPSSAYGGTLKQVVLDVYYPTGWRWNAFWIRKSGNYSFRYSREEYEYEYIWFADGKTTPKTSVWTKNWELKIVFDLTSWVISWNVGGTTYSISDSYANTLVSSFVDGTFRLVLVTRVNSNRAYIRKATFITE